MVLVDDDDECDLKQGIYISALRCSVKPDVICLYKAMSRSASTAVGASQASQSSAHWLLPEYGRIFSDPDWL